MIQNLQRTGFSLVELLVVLVILSLVSGVVVIHWAGVLRPLTIENSVERIQQMDRKIRNWTEQSNSEGWLWYDRNEHRIQIQLSTNPPRRSFYGLPDVVESVELEQYFQKSDNANNSISFSRFGVSQNYRIKLRAGETMLQVEFAGLTGQSTRVNLED